ncbi:MAG: polyprenyl synthetase family protein [Desulfovibrionaceae bacterium]|nr:polyprenyl synthetase family protein [Desulfovibrionaceae bacterium]
MKSAAKNALEPLFTERRRRVEDYLARVLTDTHIPAKLAEAMQYSLLAGGKRLRPVLCLSSAALFGCDEETLVPFAAAIEMIHTYSLIHDDLPAMDNDDLRRGKPSNHKVFGEATALLAGDGLLTEAFVSMTRTGVEPQALCAAIAELARAAGALGMVGGQEVDLELTGRPSVSLDAVQAMHALKTGALLRASCTSGALLASAPKEAFEHIAAYGSELGIAFQIADDILDEVADPALLGKPVHSDRERNKATYPALVGLDESRRFAAEHADRARRALETFTGRDADFLRALATYTVERVS